MGKQPKSLRELLGEEPPPYHFVSRPLLPQGGLLVLGGEEKTFKSMLAIDMGLALAAGEKILDTWETGRCYTTLYIEQEIGDDLLRERTQSMVQKRSPVCKDNFFVVSKDLTLVLDSEEGIRGITQDIEAVQPQVLILDPWMFFHSQDENDNGKVKWLIRNLRAITWPRKITTIIAHHQNKPSEFRPRNKPSALRGGSALAGLADSIIMVHKPIPDRRDDVVQLDFTLRAAKNPYPRMLELDNDTLTFKEYK